MQNVRDRVVQAAEDLLKEEGIYSLTLSRVLSKAGVSKGGFFHHFATKEELIHALLEHGTASFDRVREQFRAEGVGETEARIRASFHHIRNRDNFMLVSVAAVASDPALIQVVTSRMRESVELGIAEGLPPEKVRMVLLAVQGLFMERIFGVEHSPAELDELEANLLACLRG